MKMPNINFLQWQYPEICHTIGAGIGRRQLLSTNALFHTIEYVPNIVIYINWSQYIRVY